MRYIVILLVGLFLASACTSDVGKIFEVRLPKDATNTRILTGNVATQQTDFQVQAPRDGNVFVGDLEGQFEANGFVRCDEGRAGTWGEHLTSGQDDSAGHLRILRVYKLRSNEGVGFVRGEQKCEQVDAITCQQWFTVKQSIFPRDVQNKEEIVSAVCTGRGNL